jgi:hypothetical protein
MDKPLRDYLAEAARFQLRNFYYYMYSKERKDYIPKLSHEADREKADVLQRMVEKELNG